MDDTRDEIQRLARGFAAHLRHLREFRGTCYVRAAPMPSRGQVSESVPDSARAEMSREVVGTPAPTGVSAAAEVPAFVAPAREAPPRAPTRLPLADPSGLPDVAAEAPRSETDLRAQAQSWSAAEKLAYLQSRNVGACQRCKLAKSRRKIVFGVGDPNARVMFVGEAPGVDEDQQGEPFVGASGRRLGLWLERLGLTRDAVYIANVIKCRPPGNRNPEPDEIAKCSPFLQAQIRAIRPEVLIALGRFGGIFLLGAQEDTLLRAMRGRAHMYEDRTAGLRIPTFVTYHPSYVIRRDSELAPGERNTADDTVMEDLQRAMRSLRTT